MTGLAIAAFVIGAALLFFAFRPRLAFYLDEGWKFKDAAEPSEAYVGLNLVGRLAGGVLAIVMGIVLLSQNSSFDAQDAIATAADRCRNELLPRFNDTVEWTGSRLANPDEVRTLAAQLGVEVTIATDTTTTAGSPPGDLVRVLDPNRPGRDKLAFRYLGAYHDQYWASTQSCQYYTSGTDG